MRDFEQVIGSLINNQSICYLGSVDDAGFPNLKAMLAPRKRIGIKHFYLTTNTSSKRVKQFLSNPKACLYFCDKRFFRGIMLIGTISILQDKASKESIWKETDTMYYKLGVNDPDYCVLYFTATKGRFYQNFSSSDFEII